ncbi:TPA: FRG domain-containing protein, partial [Enterococcus faecalis]|nr:FRG domain-containing protein [Enterococcus faecalis]
MIHIESVSKFLSELQALGGNKEFFFRGENREFSKRSPSIYQKEQLVKNSDKYYSRLIAENPSALRSNPFETLSNLQHYGARTRLLDITSNPLIALFFAVIEPNDEPGYVYVYESEDIKFDTNHTAIMKAAINFLSGDMVMNFIKEEDSEDQDENFLQKLNEKTNLREQLCNPESIRKDLKKAHIVISTKKTDRIIRQSGNFIMPAFEYEEDSVSKSIEDLSVIDKENQVPILFEIDSRKKQKILNELSSLGINEGSVYPDVEHQTKYLERFFGEQSSITQKFSESEDKKKFIIEHYENENRIFGPKSFFVPDSMESNLSNEERLFLNGFHTTNSTFVKEEDNYFVGIRADYFVVEIGTTENPIDKQDTIDTEFAVVTANHKGSRYVT